MDAQHKKLYQRIQAFSLDKPDACFSFSKKLAKENGWSTEYTNRVIEEYKKFTFLAVVADHMVSPSDQVDQVWHLHLTYTKSYWQEFCNNILKMPLHHEPSQGGDVEQSKYNDLYNQTIETYKQFFGEIPPSDIWPNAQDRFGRDIYFKRVNYQKNWIIPKFSYPQPLILVLFFLTAFIFTGCQANSTIPNPLNFTGPEFLLFYFCSSIVVICLASILRFCLRLPYAKKDDLPSPLNLYEMAYLAGGKDRVVDTAIASLVQQQYATPDSNKRSLKFTGSINEVSDPIEEAVAIATKNKTSINDIRDDSLASLNVKMNQIQNKLCELSLLISDQQCLRIKQYPMYLILACIALGIAKIMVGTYRGKPVGFLVIMCLILGFIAISFWNTTPFRSHYGDRILKVLQKNNPLNIGSNTDENLAVALALGGTTFLPSDLRLLFMPPVYTSSRSGSSSSSGGGSSCGSGCGSGCGGGCGGCGGCGGG